MRKIVKLPHSVAFTDEKGIIYINKCLKEYNKDLYNRILKHERSHAIGAYNKKDFLLDYKNNISQWELLKFCLIHPSGFWQYSPIIKVNNKILYSWVSLAKLMIVVLMIVLTITMARRLW